MNKTALLIGATGLVGSNLLKELLLDDTFSRVKIFSRRTTGISHDKLEEIIIDFDHIEKIKNEISGDVLFSCLGTTLKQAGSKKNQYKVDFKYQFEFAKYASENKVPDYLLVSSTSAHPRSLIFYSRMKGELEEAVKKLHFSKISILQPSVLSGERKEKRTGEKFGEITINFLGKIFPFLRKYRSIKGSIVANAMVIIYKKDRPEKTRTYKLDELFSV
ncbi:MAG: NAD-dependent epimerase/dehydratase family protein [Bacteroidales bacterium]|nr:NAD-dependent epimerase/dehydratase family protein [Bacteroidales bacterium]MCF8391201.1 NAD-dependent epimerase/dehydratase family protein [Bacteroidales bacterium]